MWDLYLAYCEAAFAERYIGDFQILLAKNRTARPLYGDPPSPVLTRTAHARSTEVNT